MPQNALAATVAVQSGAQKPLNLDASGNLIVAQAGAPATAPSSSLNITAATVVKASAGTVGVVTVVVAGSGAGGVYDHASTSGTAAANQIYITAAATGSQVLNIPCTTGITVVPGTGQTIAISFI